MTRYGFEEARTALIATWGVGNGDLAHTVAELPADVPTEQALWLTHSLMSLSRAAWRSYTHPASAAEDLEPNSEGWRRQMSREAFAEVVSALNAPNLVDDDGLLLQSYIPIEEAAHGVGRALHAIGNAELTARITDEVQAELDAVDAAERGDLSGRAKQAVMLTREDASPVQVAVADRQLHDNPLGDDALFTEVDSTAAAVAAAHWLQAAADVAAEESGIASTRVLLEADNIEAIEHVTPTLVLELMASGTTPRAAVTDLIRAAMRVGDGKIPSVHALLSHLEEAQQQVRRQVPDDPETQAERLRSIRITPLDPNRPGPDLLEDLLDGIRGCWLLYREHRIDFEIERSAADEDAEDQVFEEVDDRLDASFIQAVRAEASNNRSRLL